MQPTILMQPQATDLTLLATANQALGSPGNDAEVSRLIKVASDTIRQLTNRRFYRARYLDQLPSTGMLRVLTSEFPLVIVETITENLATVLTSEYRVDDANAGSIYRESGWQRQEAAWWMLSANTFGRNELTKIAVTYWAGWLLPGDDVNASISVDGTDNSFNVASGSMPLVVAGDKLVSTGFSTAANNGTFTVVSRTATKIAVSDGTLVTETAGVRTLAVRNLPHSIEDLCIDLVRWLFSRRELDASVSSVRDGELAITYADTSDVNTSSGLPIPLHRRIASIAKKVA